MFKSALGMFLLLCVVFNASVAQAQESAASSAKEVTPPKAVTSTAKKAHASKRAAMATKSSVHSRRASSRSVKRVKSKHVASGKKSKHHEGRSLNSSEKIVKKDVVVRGKRKIVYQRVAKQVIPVVPPVLTAGDLAGLRMTHSSLGLESNAVLVMDQSTSEVLFEKNANVSLPIASITKLMTGLVVVEAHQDMNEVLEVSEDDVDREKNSASRLRVGSKLTRANMLHIALMSSENRAASSLGRHYPGGIQAFVVAMNAKAKELGMTGTHYVDANGLNSNNVASAHDLAKLLQVASHYPILCQYTTDTKYMVEPGGRALQYANSNRLVNNPDWEIEIQKTGFINEAGHCLVMQAIIDGRPIVMIFLDSKGKYSRLADAVRIRKWLQAMDTQNVVRKRSVVG